ncbi:hypothetical protein V9T40_004177 [Parthenolecanium corni]|uniref:Uncharacterized protein n=1 Tax=Parthenolecanium corni TaxID=536013 RepID=A0AAN9YA56_9HEMI
MHMHTLFTACTVLSRASDAEEGGSENFFSYGRKVISDVWSVEHDAKRIPQSRNKFTSRRNKSNYGGHQQQPRKIRRSHKSLKHLPNLRVARGTAGRGCRVQHFFRLGEQPRGREGGSAGLNCMSQDKCAKTLD